MKKYMVITILSLIIFNCQLSKVNCQTWKELMDSINFYGEKHDFQSTLKWAQKALPQAEKEFGQTDTNYAITLISISETFYFLGILDSAIYYGDLSLKIYRLLIKDANNDLAVNIENMAVFYEEKKDFNKSETLYKESLGMKRQIFKGDHPYLARSILNIAKFYNNKGDLAQAEVYYKEALEMRRRIFKDDNPDLATSIFDIANFYNSEGDLVQAEAYYKEALEMRRRIYKEDNPELAQSINNMAVLYDKIGNYDIAESLLKEVLEMSRRIFKADHPDLAQCILNTARFYLDKGDYISAEPLLKEALEMRRRIYNYDHPELASITNTMAVFYELLCNYKEAEKFLKEALEMRRRIFKGDNPGLANSINTVAIFYYGRGDFNQAEPLYKEALEMSRRLYNGDNHDLAFCINSMAIFYNAVGNYKQAEPLYKEALEMFRRIFNGDQYDLAMSINHLGLFYKGREDYKKAEPLLKEALEMCRRIFKNDHLYLASSINNLASLYNSLGNYKEAEQLFIEALEMTRRIFKGDHTDIAHTIKLLADFYKGRGNYLLAEPLYKESLEMIRHIFKNDHLDLAQSIIDIANFYHDTGNYSTAEPFYLEGLNVYFKILINYFPSLSEKEKDQFWSTMKQNFERFNTFAVKRANYNPKILCDIYENQLITKAILLNSTIKVKNRTLNSGNNELIGKYEVWKIIKDRITKLQSRSLQGNDKKNTNLDSLINEANEKEKELTMLSEDFKKEYEKIQYKWQDVQKELKQGDAAIELIRFKYFDKRWTDTVYYAALIIKKTSKIPELVLLKNGKEFEGKYIELYRQQLNQQRKQVYDPEKIETNLAELYKQFWAPIQEKLKGIKKVYLSPDGVYNQINMNTLINPKTGKYLLEEIDLRIVTSTRDLITKNTANGQRPTDHEKTAVLFGDPQFNLDSTKYSEIASRYVGDRSREYYYMGNNLDTLSRQGISSLPGTRKEIDIISSDMKAKKWEVEKFLGSDAIEDAIKNIKSPRVLHIATHGKFMKDVEIKEECSLVMETQRYVENPLLRSMLLFAGAENSIFRTGGSNPTLSQTEDGLLTAYEAMNLNLDNTELVVLSACETGLGEVKNGEGVYGLQRAFQVAGAKSLIMSLWSVSDEATQKLMTSFYDKWLSGKTKREAFREAQMELKKKYPGFYYWGAFVMLGE